MGENGDGGGVFGVLGAALLIVAVSFAVSWIWALMGVLMTKASAVQGISMLILFPLTFLSPAFVQVHTMPGFVSVNPISNVVYAVRDLANNGHIGAEFGWSLLGAGVIVAIFAPLTVRMYMKKA